MDRWQWHGKTNNFHIPSGEITVTLDGLHYFLHLPIERCLFDHQSIICKVDDSELMVTYHGASPVNANADVDNEVTVSGKTMSTT
jgi:hypothetical protein